MTENVGNKSRWSKGELTFDFLQVAQRDAAVALLSFIFPDYKNEVTGAVDHIVNRGNYAEPYKRQPMGVGAFSTKSGKMVCFVQCEPDASKEDSWWLGRLAVDPAWRNKGIGHALIEEAENFICRVPLTKSEREIKLVDGTKLFNPQSRFYEEMEYAPTGEYVGELTILSKKILGAISPYEPKPSLFGGF